MRAGLITFGDAMETGLSSAYVVAQYFGWPWGMLLRPRRAVRFHVVLWAIAGTFFFSIVQTKFHHYILPVVPALGILVAFFLDDLWEGRDRLHPLYAALADATIPAARSHRLTVGVSS